MKKFVSLLSAVLILSFSASAFDGGGKKKNKKKEKETASCCSKKDESVTDAKKEGASCHTDGAKAEASAKSEGKSEGKSCCSKDTKKSK